MKKGLFFVLRDDSLLTECYLCVSIAPTQAHQLSELYLTLSKTENRTRDSLVCLAKVAILHLFSFKLFVILHFSC